MSNMLEYLINKPIQKYGCNHVINFFEGKDYTYDYYANSIKSLTLELKNAGIQEEPVIILMDDSPICITCFLSLINIGAKPLIVSPKTIEKTLLGIANLSKSRIVITDEDIELEHLEINTLKIVGNILKSNSTLIGDAFIVSEDIAYLSLTSGSSGVPKIVMHSAEEMEAAIKYYAKKTLKITETDVLFSIPKINFTYGLANSLFFSFATGAKSILYSGSMEVECIIKMIDAYKVKYFFAVPVIYERLYKTLIKENNKLETVKYYISAGDYLSQKVVDDWFDVTGNYIYDSVGCSETGSAYLINMNPQNKPGSAGIPVEGYRLKLVGDSNRRGQLLVEGPSNAIGYLNDEENTKEKFRDNIIYTGDWFELDDDGYYWFLGRCDDMVKKNGHWVSLNQITDFVKKDSNILNAVTIFVNGKIVLILEANDDYDTKQLLEHIKGNLEHYKIPDVVKFAKIQININGKIDLKRSKENYGDI